MKRNHRRINKKVKRSHKKYADNRYIYQEGGFLEAIRLYGTQAVGF